LLNSLCQKSKSKKSLELGDKPNGTLRERHFFSQIKDILKKKRLKLFPILGLSDRKNLERNGPAPRRRGIRKMP
jgi:hypothetical protein